LHWHWKAFIENKVDAYMSQVQALEDYVASTVQAFTGQVSALIKSLSDTMLAAVGALLGSFIAALFKDKFDPTIFVIGMLIYALYVVLFPLGYNMTHHWQRYQGLVSDFQSRRERFEQRLYPENVDEIVGGQVAKSRRHFRRWFWATILAYAVVVFAAVMTAVLVPGQSVLKDAFQFCSRLVAGFFAIPQKP
jgi:small basic protein